MRVVLRTKRFDKDVALVKRRGWNTGKLRAVIDALIAGNTLPVTYRDHALKGNWADHRDCHIEPDWVLIYKLEDNHLTLGKNRHSRRLVLSRWT